MKSKVFTIISLVLMVSTCYSEGYIFHGGVRNSVYSYESEKSHTRIYQYSFLNLSTNDQKIRLNTSFRYLTDVNQTLSDNHKFLAYDFNVRITDLFNMPLMVQAGRQFLHPGTPVGALDGVKAQYSFSPRYSLMLYGGYQSNYLRNFDIEASNAIGGGTFQIKNLYHSRMQFLYLQKHNNGTTIWQIAGLNTQTHVGNTDVKIELHYDQQNSQFHRIRLSGRQRISDKMNVNVEFKQQQPQVYSNSYYTIFQVDPYTKYRAGLGYKIIQDYYLQAQLEHILFDDESADRLYLYINNQHGSIGLNYETGYVGDQVSVMFDYAIELYSKFVLSAMIDYSHYRTEEIYEYEDQLGNGLRLNYRFNKNLSIDVEYQWLTNRYKDSDNRFLNHILYRW